MGYIWINPVTAQMYDKEVLERLLEKHGYQQMVCEKDWGGIVQEKYRKEIETASCPVADVRCPAVAALLKENGAHKALRIPEIEPILLHCARELSEREDLKGQEKIITTPCEILADMGNQVGLRDTVFFSWKQFLTRLDECPPAKKLDKSPIPPGFFLELEHPTESISGKEEIRAYLEKADYGNVHMLEFLLCKDGCHNGDGVNDLE